MSVTVRPAAETEQPQIRALIQQARLNPRNLHWQNFTIAESEGQIVGLRQVKTHTQGTREVASGYVLPEYRHQGISARLMEQVLDREKGNLYLMCDQKWASYYRRFGFEQAASRELPSDFGRQYRIGRIITALLSIPARRRIRIIPMKRP
jgi:amino-acid N-acetyltransferase